jgi:hypothetical protein
MSDELTVQEMVNSNNIDVVNQGLKKLEEIKNNPPEENITPKTEVIQKETPVETETPVQQVVEEVAPKQYEFEFNGEKKVIKDEDGYLNYGSPEAMKKAAAHKDAMIKKLISENRELRGTPNNFINPPQPEIAPTSQAPTSQDTSKTENVFNPIAPPKIEEQDPTLWGEDDAKNILEFQSGVAQNLNKVGESYQELQARLKKQEEIIANIKKDNEKKQLEESQGQWWNQVESFSQKNEAFKTPKPLKVIHKEYIDWADNLAYLAKIPAPLDMNNQEQVNQYLDARNELVIKHQEGDESIVKIAENLKPPEGVEQYNKISNLMAYHADLKAKGILGQSSSIEDAYTFMTIKSGAVEKTVDSLKADTVKETRKQTVEALMETQQTNAVTIDTQQTQTETDHARVQRILSYSDAEMSQNPQKKQEYDQLMNKYGNEALFG